MHRSQVKCELGYYFLYGSRVMVPYMKSLMADYEKDHYYGYYYTLCFVYHTFMYN
jgi:hypothetical protein